MVKYEILDKIKLVDPFEPKVILGVIFDHKLAKQVRDLLLAAEELKKEPQEPKRKGRVPMSDELREAKKTIRNLELKLARYTEILEAHDLMPRPGRRRTDKDGNTIKLPRRKQEFKSKMCPGFEREAHLFTPTAGNQVLCPDCRRAQMDHQRRACGNSHSKGPVLQTTTRGMGFGAERIPSIDEIVDMMPGAEKCKWIMRMSPAEQKQYQLLKNKRDAERMRAMRHKGFTIDDPLMGVEKH